MFLSALLVEPATALIVGRGWRQAEVFGVLPDPTAVGTLGLLLLVRGRARWAAMIVPVIWCVAAGLTLRAMRAPEFWVPPAAALLAVALAGVQARARRRADLGRAGA